MAIQNYQELVITIKQFYYDDIVTASTPNDEGDNDGTFGETWS